MRVVLDTNVLVRALPGSTSAAGLLLRQLSQSPHGVVVSEAMLTELARVLRYERLRAKHGLSDEQIDAHVANIASSTVMVSMSETNAVAIVPADADDNAVVATAQYGRADVICTRDRHFQHPDVVAYCAAHGIRVVDDVTLLNELRGSTP